MSSEKYRTGKLGGRLGISAPSNGRVIADIVMSVDFCFVVLSALAAEWIYIFSFLEKNSNSSNYVIAGVLGGFCSVAVMRQRGVYSLSTLLMLRGQLNRILLGLALAFVILLGVGYLLKVSADFSRGWVTIWFGFNALLLIGHHAFVARILRGWTSSGFFANNIVIYGSGSIARRLVEHFGNNFQSSRIVGIYDDPDPDEISNELVSGGIADLIRAGQLTPINEILVALPLTDGERIAHVVSQLAVLPTNVRLCPDMAAFSLNPVGLVHHDGVAFLELVRAPMDNWAPVLKAMEDRILSAIALILVLPIMVFVALAIRLDSRGPVFFQQRRHGFNHHVISVMKFRTMNVVEDGEHVQQAQRNDPRITRIGKILRRTSLDELPQLFNVLRGDMSLVGPRPHAIAHNEYYSAILETYANRHKVKPGITGWAQVNGFRGETDTPDKMRKRVECDLYYIENWSLWLDLKILLMTPFLVFFGKNAF